MTNMPLIIDDNGKTNLVLPETPIVNADSPTSVNMPRTSFFPSKNLGCYGDGGAIFLNNDPLAAKIKK